MTQLQAIRYFMENILSEKITIARDKFDDNNFAMDIFEKSPRVKIPKNLHLKSDELDKMFRKDFVSRCPLAQGFSNVTLVLLHECGHWATRSVIDIVEYCKMRDIVDNMKDYMAIPWERLATEWAICWLYSPINRKIAKAFEKNYFGYGKELLK